MDTSIPQLVPEPLEVGMLCYPGVILLDLTGPQAVLGMHEEDLVAGSAGDSSLSNQPRLLPNFICFPNIFFDVN